MTFRGISLDGQLRLFAGEAYKSRIEKEANSRYKDRSVRERIINRLLTHDYVSFDRIRIAEERAQKERAKGCRSLLDHLRKGLESRWVTQVGLAGRRGNPALTPEMISKGHAVHYSDINQDRLLLCVERHPYAGRQPVYKQYWLYDRPAKTVRLLEEGDWIQDPILTGPTLVNRDGVCRPLDTAREEDFLRQVEADLGPSCKHKIVKMLQPEESTLLSTAALPKAVVDQIQQLTGVDIVQRETEAAAERQTKNAKKYSSPAANVPPGIFMVPGSIRLGITPSYSDGDVDQASVPREVVDH